MFFPGILTLWFSNPYLLEEIFIKKNKYHTKPQYPRDRFRYLLPNSILLQASDDPRYPAKRKSSNAAFWKGKLLNMADIVKSTLMDVVKDWVKSYPEIKTG